MWSGTLWAPALLEPWVHWIHPDVQGFYKWIFDSLGLLNEFVRQVVTSRRDSGFRSWATWLEEDLGSRPCAWHRPDFLLLLLPSLLLKTRKLRLDASLLSPTSSVLSSVRLGCRISVGLVLQLSPYTSFWTFFDPCLPLVRISLRWLRLKSLRLVGWMGGPGMSKWLCSLPGSRGWPYIAMIPEVDGDSTPLGPLCVLPAVHRLWASLRLIHLRDWDKGWVPQCVFSLGSAVSFVEAWYTTDLHVEEVLSGACDDQLRLMVADLIESFGTVDKSILDCALGRLGLHHTVSGRFTSPTIIRSSGGSGWLLAWMGLGAGMRGIPQGCPLIMVFIVALYVPW